jgi:hypothetical protein
MFANIQELVGWSSAQSAQIVAIQPKATSCAALAQVSTGLSTEFVDKTTRIAYSLAAFTAQNSSKRTNAPISERGHPHKTCAYYVEVPMLELKGRWL